MTEQAVPDGKAVINLNAEFSASDLEDIIRELAIARASLEPAVPDQPPSAMTDATVLEEEDALFVIRTRAGGGLRFWVRNSGIGWLAFSVSAERKNALRSFIDKDLGDGLQSH